MPIIITFRTCLLYTSQAVLQATRPGQTVVAGTYNAHLNRGQLALVNALCEAGRKVIAVALRNPYDLPALSEKAWKLAAFEYTPLSFDAVEPVSYTHLDVYKRHA